MKILSKIVSAFIAWARSKEVHPIPVVTHEDRRLLFLRYQPFWPDEFVGNPNGVAPGRHFNRPPWWRPFNILLHHWKAAHREEMHDHPRWSITIVLRGRLIEHTPWKSRQLKPGSVVFRTRKAIHAFEMLPGDEPWTLFIVGRRNHPQNGFIVKPFSDYEKGKT